MSMPAGELSASSSSAAIAGLGSWRLLAIFLATSSPPSVM